MSMLMSFLISREDKERAETEDTNFKSLVFANDPTLYKSLFAESEELTEKDFVEMQPQDEDELKAVLDDMRRMGVLD